MTTPHDALILQTANVYGVPFDLLQSQVIQESSGDPWAFRFEPAYFSKYIKSNTDAKGHEYGPLSACSFGLLQILLETALEIGYEGRPERLFEPKIGLAWGTKYLAQCIAREGGDTWKGLARYNGNGPRAMAYADQVYARAGRVRT